MYRNKRSLRLIVLVVLILAVAAGVFFLTSDVRTTLVVLGFLAVYALLEGVFWGGVAWLDRRKGRA